MKILATLVPFKIQDIWSVYFEIHRSCLLNHWKVLFSCLVLVSTIPTQPVPTHIGIKLHQQQSLLIAMLAICTFQNKLLTENETEGYCTCRIWAENLEMVQ